MKTAIDDCSTVNIEITHDADAVIIRFDRPITELRLCASGAHQVAIAINTQAFCLMGGGEAETTTERYEVVS